MNRDPQAPPPDVVEWAKALIAAPLTEEVAVELIELVRTATDDRARMAAWALGFGEVPERLRTSAVSALLEVLGDTTRAGGVRGQTAEALAEQLEYADPVDAVRAATEARMINMLSDPCATVRSWSAHGLGKLRTTTAVPFLRMVSIDATLVPGWWTVGEEATDSIDNIEGREPPERVGKSRTAG